MFDSRAFRSRTRVLLGGAGFGALFALVMLLADALFDGRFRLSWRVLLFGGVAFASYVGTAWLIRQEETPRTD